MINILKSLFWLLIYFYLKFYQKDYYENKRTNKVMLFLILFSLLYFSLIYCLGFINGFNFNPYKQSIGNIIYNFINQIIPIIGMEKLRYYLVKRCHKDKNKLVIIILIFFLLDLNYKTIFSLNKNSIKAYFWQYLFPKLINHMLVTYIFLENNFIDGLVYRLLPYVFILFMPILPDINWYNASILTIFYNLIIYIDILLINKSYVMPQINVKLMLFLGITLIYGGFMMGMFKYKPIVILSNSMFPVYEKGDLIIYEKESKEELENLHIGDIILYKSDNKIIAHRIIAKNTNNNEVWYLTKGDNNKFVDQKKISIDLIEGVYKFHLKYLGYFSVWLNT